MVTENSSHIKVLIVDDVREMVVNLDEIIWHSFPSVETEFAFTATEAIKKIDILNPHFILLDIGLANDSGLTVLKHARNAKSKSKVIMVSNYADPVHKNICIALGADAFIDKSKEFHTIPDIILSFLQNETIGN